MSKLLYSLTGSPSLSIDYYKRHKEISLWNSNWSLFFGLNLFTWVVFSILILNQYHLNDSLEIKRLKIQSCEQNKFNSLTARENKQLKIDNKYLILRLNNVGNKQKHKP